MAHCSHCTLETALQVIYKTKRNDDWDNTAAQRRINQALIGSIIATSYNYETYTIEGIDYNSTPETTFEWYDRSKGETKEISYAEYIKETRGIEIQDYDQPMLVTTGRGGMEIKLIPEVCLLTDMYVVRLLALILSSDKMAKQKLPQICSVKPPDRVIRYNNLLTKLREKDSPQAKVRSKHMLLSKHARFCRVSR